MKECIIGAGFTGLTAALKLDVPVFEAKDHPGGICRSYYQTAEGVVPAGPSTDTAFRFETGGGHWMFGGIPEVCSFLEQFCSFRSYRRRAAVWFPGENLRVPYPIQNHLNCLGADFAARSAKEICEEHDTTPETMDQWLLACFGEQLCRRFFFPFHELYTAGLYTGIAQQDPHKTPVDREHVLRGATPGASEADVGYNAEFLYPRGGLDKLIGPMSRACKLRCGKRVTQIDLNQRTIAFADGDKEAFDRLYSTLPLDRMLEMSGVDKLPPADPFTSVLVLNIGGIAGPNLPQDHWLYHPVTRSGFHRTGIYSNVDRDFLPSRLRDPATGGASFYIEKAFPPGTACPAGEAMEKYIADVVSELQEWGFIETAEVVSPTWIPVAYTWQRPGSSWREEALELLRDNGVRMLGRYGRWHFQGIAASVAEGLALGD